MPRPTVDFAGPESFHLLYRIVQTKKQHTTRLEPDSVSCLPTQTDSDPCVFVRIRQLRNIDDSASTGPSVKTDRRKAVRMLSQHSRCVQGGHGVLSVCDRMHMMYL